jgi:dTDP-4-dehydrorhamnose 3,5-epimerase
MTDLRLDGTASAGVRDAQTVTRAGASVARAIEGVVTHAPVNHVDHRGRVFEIHAGPSDFWADPLVYCYTFTIRPGQTKGWGLHREKEDRYTLVHGEVLTLLYDAREDSPTHGVVQKVTLTEQGVRQLRIPTGVWHMNVNLGEHEAFLINHPTVVYHHEAPDRLLLPWDTDQIPVDLADYFPVQHRARGGRGA